ncbi:D-alanyl-D-alanine carboxypeptidase (penicillin-binding protein 5/6) [Desulfonatronum thiosulfatophilum]|uniref:serine-type D-Ala-D-Ala carboxypeptidase n=1 Tax=Desulfonatronum thiosulfatophilum TaxID=617002 RepID=A0A1G6CAD1_9BACT|nr:D-alanyl-D-alanine carboxypeptidase family protein [Desulfonatronum thiosulfatophilum]SDB29810.1 D-alanyl-D-alanine carboxypeptidase (penicillin-binding protein 5/6) [Desulfonatronum thiosulfatophilum]
MLRHERWTVQLRIAALFFAIWGALLFTLPGAMAWAQAAMHQESAVPFPSGGAEAYLLMDAHSGRLLVSHNIDALREPASLTKMMTVYVAGRELNAGRLFMSDMVRVGRNAWRMTGSRMFLDLNSEVSVAALLHGIIVQSGNDASVALAEHIAGSEGEFVKMMNQAALDLGMTSTNFANATGLPAPGVHTTARDLARLSLALMHEHPYLYSLHSVREFEHNNIKQTNRNRLLHRDPSVDGIKTGYTRAAGYCQATSAQRGEMRLIAVVLGCDSVAARTRLNQQLLEYGFNRYETHRLYARNEPLGSVKLWKARQSELSYGIQDDIFITIPKGQIDVLDRRISLSLIDPVFGPVLRGQKVGTLQVALGEEVLAEQDLLALTEADEAGFFSQMVDTVRLLLLRNNLLHVMSP